MKILIISDAWKPQLNGVVRTYELLCEELEKTGHDTKVIGPCDFPHRFQIPGYKEIELAFMPYKRLKKMIEDYKPDTIHIATEATLGAAGRKYCIKNGIPFTTSYHTHFPDYVAKRVARFMPFLYGGVKNLLIKKLRRFHEKSACIMIATQSLEDDLRRWGFTAPISRLTRGVKLDQFTVTDNDIFKDLKKPVALYVGRVAIEKNIEAFLDMSWNGTKVIVGHGPNLDEYKRKYSECIFTGKKEGQELAAHFQSADIFVFPSKTDTFGIVLIEALASGTPVAAYNVTGPKDIITEDFLGVIDDDLAIAANKATQVPGTPQDRHDYICNNYTLDIVASQFMNAISKYGA